MRARRRCGRVTVQLTHLAGQLTEGEKREKPDGLARPASLGMNCYGLTTRLKVPPNAVMPLPLQAGVGAPFDAGASFSLLNR